MEIKILRVFPKAIMSMTMDREFTQKELDFIVSQNNSLLENMGNTSSEDMDVLRHAELADLKKFIQKTLDMYFLHIYQPKTPGHARLTLTQSWLNFTKKGEHHHLHSHPNSVISGCLYINAKKGEDMIVFQKRDLPHFQIEAGVINEFNSLELNVSVGTKDIVLFPSDTLHRVPITTGDDMRISLAFNSFFRGKIGNVDSDHVNYLEI
jgi:uncharacterized protein (TIGR02466 family)